MVKGGRTGKVAVNGWSAIKIPIQQIPNLINLLDSREITEIPLDVLRKRYLADLADDDPVPAESTSSQEKGWIGRTKKQDWNYTSKEEDNVGFVRNDHL
ncbi:hypothetical protein BGZ65_003518 [Modicella reniformis]|uniref:Uncharacterized protein n=1 Tax=Modicella reniformis TaxID=1440133 RepID=A0A9P6LU98_9FUNG|nr:hypothetical protein BGZ65_003518 [Modicella reniformis]